MYLYATSLRGGLVNPVKVIEWAVEMTQKINQISEVPTTLWATSMSPGMGTLAFVSVVEALSEIEATETKLAADPGYNALVERAIGLLSTDPVDQTLENLVYPDPDAATITPEYATVVRANMAPGMMVSGIEAGIELAQRAKQITGRPTSFTVTMTGVYGTVSWVSLAESVDQLQAAGEALNADPEFGKLVDGRAGKCYLPGATQTVARKIA